MADRREEAAVPQIKDSGTQLIPAQAPFFLEINETQITELQNRIQELQRQQLVAQSALAQQTRLLGALPQDPLSLASNQVRQAINHRNTPKIPFNLNGKSVSTCPCLRQMSP